MVEIERIECTEFDYPKSDVAPNPHGWGYVYDPGTVSNHRLFAVRIHTDTGVVGEYVVLNGSAYGHSGRFGDYLVGENPFDRERHWQVIKNKLRGTDRVGLGPFDVALWDLAGKRYDAPIHELLGTYREELPTYATMYYPDDNGGLDSPEAIADFAETLRDRGFLGVKFFGFNDERTDVRREVETVHAVGERVGDDMELIFDGLFGNKGFAKALKIGRALDEYGFAWFEDPYADNGLSINGNRTLREHIETPVLTTGEIQSLEGKTDFVVNGGTDFVKASMTTGGGVTGAIKAARMAEGMGLDIEYHITGPAARHCQAAVRNSNYYELAQLHPDLDETAHDYPAVYEDYSDDADAVVDGHVTVPDGPGLGVEYDWDFIEDNAVRSKTFERS
jgi:L-alanine-DL-glutamate epimerase-like enolase superfamily enzyme